MRLVRDITKYYDYLIIILNLINYLQVLALTALIAAGACQTSLRLFTRTLAVQTNSAAGWVIFLSFWVMLYQALAIVQLFLHVKFVYYKIPVINWSVFFLVVSYACASR